MCTGAEPYIIGAMLGVTASSMMSSGQSPMQQPVAPPAPPAPPATQAGKTPTQQTFRAQNAATASAGGPFAGNATTLLTGAGGLDISKESLGKNKTLGE